MDCWERKTVLVSLIAYLLTLNLLTGCKEKAEKLPFYNTPDFTPHFIAKEEETSAAIPHVIKNFSLRDQNNTIVTEKDIEGKIHVGSFFFTSCGSICPKIMHNLSKVDSVFRNNKNVVLLSYTVTPWIDSVARLKKYALKHQINNPGWHLLTGNRSDIYKLARQSYFAEEDLGFSKDSTDFLHSEHLLLIDRHKRIRGVYNGTLQLEALQLIKDIENLLEE